MKKQKHAFLLLCIGIVLGSLTFGGFIWAQAVQNFVGIYARDTGSGWRPIRDATNYPQGATANNNTGTLVTGMMTQGNNSAWNPVTAAFADGIATNAPGLPGFQMYTRTSAGTFSRAVSFDRARNGNDSFNALGVGVYIPADEGSANFRMAASAGYTLPIGASNLPVTAQGLHDPATNTYRTQQNAASLTGDTSSGNGHAVAHPTLFNGATYDRGRGISATNLTDSTSRGSLLTAHLSTWSETNTPAAATQATASKAAGAAGVRHVAVGLTACIAASGTAQTPIFVNLRDGATGVGTILWTLAFSAPINTSQCESFLIPSKIGTAATAMTLEFGAAGVVDSRQTVTLNGYSVQE